MRFRLRNAIAIGALTSGLIAGGALVANAATTTGTTGTSGTTGSSTYSGAGSTGTSGTSGSGSSGTTKHCTDMGTGSGSRPTQGEAPAAAPASG
jgi:hypothetical protein